jgi:hypothetical protein
LGGFPRDAGKNLQTRPRHPLKEDITWQDRCLQPLSHLSVVSTSPGLFFPVLTSNIKKGSAFLYLINWEFQACMGIISLFRC